MLKVVALVLLLAVGVGTAGYAVFGSSASTGSAGQYLTAAATLTNVVRQAVATGSVAAASTFGLAFGSPPEIDSATTSSSGGSGASTTSGSTWTVKTVNATVGAVVKAGDILATADTSGLASQLATAQANLASAQAKLTTDGGGPAANVVVTAQDSVTSAQLAYSQALANQKNSAMSSGVSIAQAQLGLTNAENQYALDQKGPTGATLASDQDALNQAHASVTTAEQNLTAVKSSDALSLQQAQAAVVTAQQNLTNQQASDALSLQQAQAAVTSATQALANQKTQDQQTLDQALSAVDLAQSKVAGDVQGSAAYQTDLAALNAANAAYSSAQTKATQAEQSAQNAITSAQAGVTSAQQKAAQADQSAQNAITSAQTGVTSAQQKASQAELSAQNQIASAKASLVAAEHAYELKVQPAATTLLNDQKAIASAQQSLNAAEVQAQTSASSAAAQVTSAAQGVTAAKNGYTTAVAPAASTTIAADQAVVTTDEAALSSVQQSIAAAQITAPVAGTIVSVSAVPGIVAPSGFAIVLQGSTLEVTAAFTETDTPSLANGQTAAVTVKAIGTTPVAATVTSISPEPSSTSSGGVVTYPVTLTLKNPPASVKVGMSASVAVTTASATGVIAVPSTALHGAAGNYTVMVLDSSGQAQTVSVQVGLIASGLAEIQSGVSAGDLVVTGSSTVRTGTTAGGAGITIPGLGGAGGVGGGGFGGGGRGGGGGQ
jgi:RND family efflux transporter MFP subunit